MLAMDDHKATSPAPLWQRVSPHLRAAFILVHAVAVLLIALPSSHNLSNKRAWKNANSQEEFRTWASRLSGLGYETTPEEFEADLWKLSKGWLSVRAVLIAPFRPYSRYVGVRQGWRMFSNPQAHPGELQVEIKEGAGPYQTVYLSRSDEHEWRRHQFDHNRTRKMIGRFARTFNVRNYDNLGRWIARQAAVDFPAATEARVTLRRFDSITPEAVRDGVVAPRRLTKVRRYNLIHLRRTMARETAP